MAGQFKPRAVYRDPIPKIIGSQNDQRNIVKKPAGRTGRFAQSILFKQPVLPHKGKQDNNLYDAKNGAYTVFNSDDCIE